MRPEVDVSQSASIQNLLHRLLEAQAGRVVLWLPVMVGLGTAGYFALRNEQQLWLGAVAVLLALVGVWCVRGLLVWRAVMLGLCAVALGFFAAQWRTAGLPEQIVLPRAAQVVDGIVLGVDLLPEGRRIVLGEARLSPDAAPLQRQLRVRLQATDTTTVQAGDRVRVRARFLSPAWPSYPGAVDFQRVAFFQKLAGSGFALGQIELVQHAQATGAGLFLRGVRDAIIARVMTVLPAREGAVAGALLTGAVTAINADDLQAFRASGLAHLLSVSGLHIAIVIGLVMTSLRFMLALMHTPALRWPAKEMAAAAGIVAGLAYLLLTGMQVPTLRSFLMAALVMLGLMLGRPALTLRGLGFAAFIVLLYAPEEITGPSFQMSFGAVLALVAGWEVFQPRLLWLKGQGRFWQRWAFSVMGLFVASVLAGVATMPFGMYHFQQAQLWSVAANMVAIPLTSVLVMPAGVVALLLMPFGLDGWALTAMGWGLTATLFIAHEVASWPEALVRVPLMPLWGLGAVTFGFLWMALWKGWLRALGVPLAVLGMASPWMHAPPDLLVSQDARLIAVRTAAGVQVQRVGTVSKFTMDTWARAWDLDALPNAEARTSDICPDSTTTCLVPGTRVMVMREALHDTSCEGADVVLSSEPLQGLCGDVESVDRFNVWRDGAYAGWFTRDGMRLLSDRAWRGARPWVPPAPLPRSHATEPPALLDQ